MTKSELPMPKQEEWRPGSFTKNFSWGSNKGLKELYDIIRLGFDGTLEDVPRDLFRSRVAGVGRPDFIAINFFLCNARIGDKDYILVDELVFQALELDHSPTFDRLALLAFLYSMVGSWTGAKSYQIRPAMWAHHYVSDRVARDFNWNASRVTSDDIQAFVKNDPRWDAQTERKLSTNLNYLFKVGGLGALASRRVERWWLNGMWLALDRLIEVRRAAQETVDQNRLDSYLTATGFNAVSGPTSIEKDLARRHIIDLYKACGGRSRFNSDAVMELTRTTVNDLTSWIANNPEPVEAVHLTNPRIVKTIPRPCALIAKMLGFEIFNIDELAELELADLVRSRLDQALARLKGEGISPRLTAEELMRLLRE